MHLLVTVGEQHCEMTASRSNALLSWSRAGCVLGSVRVEVTTLGQRVPRYHS